MKRLATFVLGMALLPLLVILGAIVSTAVYGQVTDKPITAPYTQWRGKVQHISINDKQGCVAGWVQPDRYADFQQVYAVVDGIRLDSAQQAAVSVALTSGAHAALLAARNINLTRADPALQPCLTKLEATLPPAPWTVAPSSTGKRPAYLLLASGARGAQSGTAETTISDTPMWCDCRVRSVETTSSTYCEWAMARQSFDAAEPKRVTLCRESKPAS